MFCNDITLLLLARKLFDPSISLLHPIGVPAFVSRFILEWRPICRHHVQQLLRKGKSPVEIHTSLCRLRSRRKVEPPHITNLRRVLKGFTYKRSAVETHGRKENLSRRRSGSCARASGLLSGFSRPGRPGSWIFDFGLASVGCPFLHKTYCKSCIF